jgi:hypothetical protein
MLANNRAGYTFHNTPSATLIGIKVNVMVKISLFHDMEAHRVARG